MTTKQIIEQARIRVYEDVDDFIFAIPENKVKEVLEIKEREFQDKLRGMKEEISFKNEVSKGLQQSDSMSAQSYYLGQVRAYKEVLYILDKHLDDKK